MKHYLTTLMIGFSLVCLPAYADIQTTTTITNAPPETTITTVTRDDSIPTHKDDLIVSEVYKKFSKAPALIGTKLTVTSLNGIVTINGVVTAQAQADAAIEAAKSTEGVASVDSKITVTTNPDLNKPGQAVPKY